MRRGRGGENDEREGRRERGEGEEEGMRRGRGGGNKEREGRREQGEGEEGTRRG